MKVIRQDYELFKTKVDKIDGIDERLVDVSKVLNLMYKSFSSHSPME